MNLYISPKPKPKCNKARAAMGISNLSAESEDYDKHISSIENSAEDENVDAKKKDSHEFLGKRGNSSAVGVYQEFQGDHDNYGVRGLIPRTSSTEKNNKPVENVPNTSPSPSKRVKLEDDFNRAAYLESSPPNIQHQQPHNKKKKGYNNHMDHPDFIKQEDVKKEAKEEFERKRSPKKSGNYDGVSSNKENEWYDNLQYTNECKYFF